MRILNYIPKSALILITGLFVISFLNSCGFYKPVDSRIVSPNSKERVKKNLEEGRGFRFSRRGPRLRLAHPGGRARGGRGKASRQRKVGSLLRRVARDQYQLWQTTLDRGLLQKTQVKCRAGWLCV